jgi:hypothetical protein
VASEIVPGTDGNGRAETPIPAATDKPS